jgi:hypothetical protein
MLKLFQRYDVLCCSLTFNLLMPPQLQAETSELLEEI